MERRYIDLNGSKRASVKREKADLLAVEAGCAKGASASFRRIVRTPDLWPVLHPPTLLSRKREQ